MRKPTMSLFLLLFLLSSVSLAQVPQSINYQGVLRNKSTNELLEGSYDMTFSIYPSPEGGDLSNAQWSESHPAVQVANGLYSVQLGNAEPTPNPIDPAIFDGQTKYLEVIVNGQTMSPRVALITVPYAFRSEYANSAGATMGGNANTLNGLSAEAFVKLGPSGTQSTSAPYGLNVRSDDSQGVGVYGWANGVNAKGGLFQTATGTGVSGTSVSGPGVVGATTSNDGVTGTSSSGAGVIGKSKDGSGVEGQSTNNVGVYGIGKPGVIGFDRESTPYNQTGTYGILGGEPLNAPIASTDKYGAYGQADADNYGYLGYYFLSIFAGSTPERAGVYGYSKDGFGLKGFSINSHGVHGTSSGNNKAGVYGETTPGKNNIAGVYGKSSESLIPGVCGSNEGSGTGVEGIGNIGVKGTSTGSYGVHGFSKNSYGVYGESKNSHGVVGVTGLPQTLPTNSYYGGFFTSTDRGLGVRGDAYITGISYAANHSLIGANTLDLAEWVKANDISIENGDVLILEKNNYKCFTKSSSAYSTLVAGIVSTNPAFLAGTHGTVEEPLNKEKMEAKGYKMLALAGQVPCKVSTENGLIEVGDLLTTSNTPGYAMKAIDPKVGTVLGKAMEPLASGKGKIMVLVTLQ